MANTAWLAAPIAMVVLHRLAWGGGATTATTTLLVLAAATFAGLMGLGLVLRRIGVRSRALGLVLAGLFWLSALSLSLPNWIGADRIELHPITLGPTTEQRDLIVIMVDDYPSSDALLDDHGYDNAEFRLDLSIRGFRVVPEAWSNSSHPLLAMTSALSGRYPGTPGNERDRRRLTAMLDGDNPVADLLRRNGYATTHLGAPSAESIWFRGPGRSGTATAAELAAAIEAASANETPDFVFAHLSGCDTSSSALDDVVARTICSNRLILDALDHLSGETPTDAAGAVAVITGTRGARIDDALGDNPAGWPRSAIVRGLGVFAAVELAPGCQPPPDDATAAVIVHHGVACALGVPPDPATERAVVIKGGVIPNRALDVNLNVLRSNLSGQNLRKAQ